MNPLLPQVIFVRAFTRIFVLNGSQGLKFHVITLIDTILIINDVNLGEHVVRSVVVAVVDVVGGVHLAALAALVTGRLRQKIESQSYSSQLKLELQIKVRKDFTIT